MALYAQNDKIIFARGSLVQNQTFRNLSVYKSVCI